MNIIIEDKKKIDRIEIFTQHSSDIMSFEARNGYEIIPYHENGEMAPIIWFAVVKDDVVTDRINSKYVQLIQYKD